MRSTESTTGNYNLTTGDGEDRVQFQEGFAVGGNQTTDTGDGDRPASSPTATPSRGTRRSTSAAATTACCSAGNTIVGGSTLNYMDAITVRERGDARKIQSDYSVVTQGGTGEATVLLDAGSEVGGNLTVDTFGESIVRLELTGHAGQRHDQHRHRVRQRGGRRRAAGRYGDRPGT